MCVPKILTGAIGGLAAGGPAGALGGLTGVLANKLLSKKKATDPTASTPAYQSALAQGVSAKRALKSAIVVNQRNAAAGGY